MSFGGVLIQRFRFYFLAVLLECRRLNSREIWSKLYFQLTCNSKTQVQVYLLVFLMQMFYYFI